MTMWQLLEIEPTDDLKTIKKAYAKKLKQHHPEDDPEGYQALREAYDVAIQQAKHNREELQFVSEQFAEQDGVPIVPSTDWLTTPAPQPSVHDQLGHIIEKARALYLDFPSRIELQNWSELLSDNLMWNIEQRPLITHMFKQFLQEHRNLPKNIWQLIESTFHWRSELQDHEADPFMQYYLQQLDGPELNFSFLHVSLALEDLDRFLSLRAAACEALRYNDKLKASQHIDEAKVIFAHDPDLIRLNGELLIRSGKLEEALEVYTELISSQPSNLDGYISRTRILYRLGRFRDAITDCQLALKHAPDHMGLQCLLGMSLKNHGDNEEALVVFEKLHKTHPYDLQIKGMLIELYNMQGKQWPNSSVSKQGLLGNWLQKRGLTLSPARCYHLRPGAGSYFLLCCVFTMISMALDNTYTQMTILTAFLMLLSTILFIRAVFKLFKSYMRSLG